jgi:hypothetical protein
MSQTTAPVVQSNFQAEVSLDGSIWTDISGTATNVSVDGGDQITGTQFTADGSVPLVLNSNKTEAQTVTVSCVYTETTGEAHQVVYDRYIGSDKTIFFRYAPRGSAVANKRYVASNAANTAIKVAIVSCTKPEVDAESGDAALFEFSLLVPKLFQEAIS